AIIVLNPNYALHNQSITLDGRIITTTIIDVSNEATICHIANIYAPANIAERPPFYQRMQQHPILQQATENWFLLGDLNIHYHDSPLPGFLHPWRTWLQSNFLDIFQHHSINKGAVYTPAPTFTRGRQRSTIDYIFCTRDMLPSTERATQEYLPPEWTDHAMLKINVLLTPTNTGPGTWRFNNQFLEHDQYCKLLLRYLDLFFDSDRTFSSIQEQWDSLKTTIKKTAMHYGRMYSRHRRHRLGDLQRQRRQIIERHLEPQYSKPLLDQQLQEVEQAIASEAKGEVERLIIRSHTKWTEDGESSNKYFFRVLKARQQQVTINRIRDPIQQTYSTTPAAMLKQARNFYQALYTADSHDHEALHALLSTLPPNVLSQHQQQKLVASVSESTLADLLKHSPRNRSPGLDGISFEVYRYLFSQHKRTKDLLLQILEDAQQGQF
ncbi:hypothetical protein, partial, partial [Absidia glauca]